MSAERPAIYNRQGSRASHGIDHDDNLEEELYKGKDFREEESSMSSVISHELVEILSKFVTDCR